MLMTAGQAAAQTTMGIKDCMQYAVENSAKIAAEDERQSQYAIDRRDAWLNAFTPSVSASSSVSYSSGRIPDPETNMYSTLTTIQDSYQLYGEITLFDGFNAINRIKISKIAILSGKESRQAKEDDICLNTIQQYCSYTYYSQMSALAERQLQNASLALQKVRREYSLGSKSQQDVLEKEVFEANAENTFAEYNALKNKALMELKSAMFYPAADSLVVDTMVNANNAAPISDAQQTALSAVANNANTVIAKNNMEIRRIELNTARWQLLPRITMDANWYSYRTTYPDNKGASISFYDQMKMHEQKSVGVRISIPIYGRLGKFSNISRKKSDYRIASYEYDERCREIENAVYSTYDDAASAEKSLQAAQKAATLNQKYFEAAQLKFDLGTISYIDFNEVYNKYLESQAKYYNALYTYMIKNAVVEYYRGTPYLEQF